MKIADQASKNPHLTMTEQILITAELSLDQAREFAEKILAAIGAVEENIAEGFPDSYCFIRQDALANNCLRIRIGD